MAFPIDIEINAQWSKATFAGVVGKASNLLQDPNKLVIPQSFHDAAADRVVCPFIHPIGTKDGEPAIFFPEQEMRILDESVKFTLVGQFVLGHPKMELVRNSFESISFVGEWKIGLLNGRHLPIQLSVEEDYARLFAKQSLQIAGTSMKIIKWTPEFDPSKEPPVVPLWFKLPHLPHKYLKHSALFNIGQAMGIPLKVDPPTFNNARPVVARICVERDVTLPELKRIWIGSDQEGFWQEVTLEQRPYYCQHCRMFGHTLDRCFRLHPPSRRNVPKGPSAQGTFGPSTVRVSRISTSTELLQEGPSEAPLIGEGNAHDNSPILNPPTKIVTAENSPSESEEAHHFVPSPRKEPLIEDRDLAILHNELEEEWQVQRSRKSKKLISPSSLTGTENLILHSDADPEDGDHCSLSPNTRNIQGKKKKKGFIELKRLQDDCLVSPGGSSLNLVLDSLSRTRGKSKSSHHD